MDDSDLGTIVREAQARARAEVEALHEARKAVVAIADRFSGPYRKHGKIRTRAARAVDAIDSILGELSR